jgi:hypothetical protein
MDLQIPHALLVQESWIPCKHGGGKKTTSLGSRKTTNCCCMYHSNSDKGFYLQYMEIFWQDMMK